MLKTMFNIPSINHKTRILIVDDFSSSYVLCVNHFMFSCIHMSWARHKDNWTRVIAYIYHCLKANPFSTCVD